MVNYDAATFCVIKTQPTEHRRVLRSIIVKRGWDGLFILFVSKIEHILLTVLLARVRL